MEHISIIDYIGNCNEKGEATGHVLKTLTEAINMLKMNFDIDLILTNDYIKYFEQIKIKYTLGLSSRSNYKKGIFSKYIFKIQKIYFTYYVLKHEKKMWFINTDFWLFLSLMFFNKKKEQQIYVTNYIDYYSKNGISSRIKNFVFEQAMKNIDYVFTTNSNIKLKKHVYIPDYSFDDSVYKKYLNSYKEKLVYMCGGINSAKDIEGLINSFNISGENLIIKGNFSSEKQFIKLKKISKSNIKIYNNRLDDDEYYENIARSLFIALPYKKENYNNRSSGVILEAIFLQSIVIAPNFLLNQLDIAGIGYETIEELSEFCISNISENRIKQIRKYNKEILKKYEYKIIAQKYIDIFEQKK